jgi:hypothetical protein
MNHLTPLVLGRFLAVEIQARRTPDIIDGRAIVAAHAQREMPVWGDRYRRAIGANESSAAIEQRAPAQIAALVRYIESIQAK